MTKRISIDGLVIWETKTSDADKVITVLTGNGVISCYARGSLKPGGKLTSPCDLLSFSNFELYSGKNMYTVVDAKSNIKFNALSIDIERYSLAVYFCELIRFLAPVDDYAGEYLGLMLNSLHLLNEGKKDLMIVKAVFELRMMTLCGYMPDLDGCNRCGVALSPEICFDFIAGNWYCRNCINSAGLSANCSSSVLLAMKHIVEEDASKIFSFSLPEDKLRVLNKITSDFVETQSDRKFRTLEYFRSISKDGYFVEES
ncbi:MAG: DNA repair protein RecO [Ruminococcaceae bacterium]|nr:DNA repair protein RecO [Oscillospiraceae bacterium]